MENKIWWYAINNEQKGPISESELKLLVEHKIVIADSLIWKEGLQNWIRFSEISLHENHQHETINNNNPGNFRTTYSQNQNVSSPNTFSRQNIDSYYQREFDDIIRSQENYKGKWNWWAFLFGWIWCLTNGLWQYALLSFIPYLIMYLFISIGMSWLIGLAWAIFFGLKGTWLYYNLKVKNKSF